jgi:hypothetical protein
MLTVQDIIDKCTDMFRWVVPVTEQQMAAFIYDLEPYESICDADKLDILMFHIDEMQSLYNDRRCSSMDFLNKSNLEPAIMRTRDVALGRHRSGKDSYIYRKYLVHDKEGHHAVL